MNATLGIKLSYNLNVRIIYSHSVFKQYPSIHDDIFQTADDCGAFPRPNSELAPLTGNGFRGVKSRAPWGLKLDALPPIQTAENSNGDLNKAVKEILRYK